MKGIKDLIIALVYPTILVILGLWLAWANYTPNTFLTGWDTLHPELNLSEAFSRTLNGVWRSDQGLGAVAGHSHMSELPRLVYLWLTGFIAPTNQLRYLFFFVSLITGVLGIYRLVVSLLKKDKDMGALPANTAGFAGGLLYLTSLGTLQHFIVPFEMFAIAYAMLPWWFLTAGNYIHDKNRKHLLAFAFVTLLSAPMAYAATLWYASFFGLVLFMLAMAHGKTIARAVTLIVLTLTINAYWILPNLYFVKNHGVEVQESKINRLFTPEAFAKNQEFGSIGNAVILKNFLFDWQLFDFQKNGFTQVTAGWTTHFTNPLVTWFYYGVFGLVMLGVLTVIRETREKKHTAELAMLPVFAVSFLMLLNGTWPVSAFFAALGNASPILKEALRFPFTKFSPLVMVCFGVYAGFGVAWILRKLAHTGEQVGAVALLTAASIYAFLPAFQGQLINPAMRISYPAAYAELSAYMNSKNRAGRVAVLPIHSPWGWTYYRWGYQGSGFLQFFLPQPILDRDYDRWNPSNEQYYREMSYAVYSQNPAVLSAVLTKFNIRYVLLDTSVFAPGMPDNQLLTWAIPTLLTDTGLVTGMQTFGDTITVFGIEGSDEAIYGTDPLPSVNSKLAGSPFDETYAAFGDYSQPADAGAVRGNVNSRERYVGDVGGELVATISATQLLPDFTNRCDFGTNTTSRTPANSVIRYASADMPGCDSFGLPELSHTESYVLSVTSRLVSGFPMQLCLSNTLTGHCDILTHLTPSADFVTEQFLIPPTNDFGYGYAVDLNNYTITGTTTVNEIKDISITRIEQPFALPSVPLRAGKRVAPRSEQNGKWHIYKLQMQNDLKSGTLVLDQAFEEEWKAYVINGKLQMTNDKSEIIDGVRAILSGTELTEHVVVNNWANGWLMKSTNLQMANDKSLVVIVFWPQYLEYFGFFLLPLGILVGLLVAARPTKHE